MQGGQLTGVLQCRLGRRASVTHKTICIFRPVTVRRPSVVQPIESSDGAADASRFLRSRLAERRPHALRKILGPKFEGAAAARFKKSDPDQGPCMSQDREDGLGPRALARPPSHHIHVLLLVLPVCCRQLSAPSRDQAR